MKHLCLTKQCGLFGRGELAAVDGCQLFCMEATEGFVDGLLAELGTETTVGIQNELNDWVECVAGGDRDKADSAGNTLTIDVVGHE